MSGALAVIGVGGIALIFLDANGDSGPGGGGSLGMRAGTGIGGGGGEGSARGSRYVCSPYCFLTALKRALALGIMHKFDCYERRWGD